MTQKIDESINIKIEDWYDTIKPFKLVLHEGPNYIIGPNGAGKTTLIDQVNIYAKNNNFDVITFNNLDDGGSKAIDNLICNGLTKEAAKRLTLSEGQQIKSNIEHFATIIGHSVAILNSDKNGLFVLLDALDSGFDISNIKECKKFFNMIIEEELHNMSGKKIYILISANSYEFTNGNECIDSRTGLRLKFKDYEDYSEYICSYYNYSSKSLKRHLQKWKVC